MEDENNDISADCGISDAVGRRDGLMTMTSHVLRQDGGWGWSWQLQLGGVHAALRLSTCKEKEKAFLERFRNFSAWEGR